MLQPTESHVPIDGRRSTYLLRTVILGRIRRRLSKFQNSKETLNQLPFAFSISDRYDEALDTQ